VLQGKVYGELDPHDPHNAIIQDINLAPRNAKGMVEYVTTFTLQEPLTPPSKGVLLYEVVNRGASITPHDFSHGDYFLQSGWQGDIPFEGASIHGTPAETIRVPVAHALNGPSITGPVIARFIDVKPGVNTLPIRAAIGYATSGTPPLPIDLDTSHARLISKQYEDIDGVSGPVTTIPSTEWSWGDCSSEPFPGKLDSTKLCAKSGFDPNLLYQLEYTGKDPLVLGVGLASMRDICAFFHYSPQDDTGTSNPIAGKIQHTIAIGSSQAGNVIRTFLNLGFNQDEQGRQVWDGTMPIIAVRQNPINFRFAIPGGATSLYELGSDGVDWWQHGRDKVRHQPDAGLLDRCTASKTCPKIVEVLGSSEFWTLRGSPDFVDTTADRDIPLPDNVRRYYVASTQHGGGRGGFHWAVEPQSLTVVPATSPIVRQSCVLPANPNPMKEVSRALLIALREWVVDGKLPPPSRYPKLADATLAPANQVIYNFPAIPGLPHPRATNNPFLIYDLGSNFLYNDLSGYIDQMPPLVVGEVASVLPKVDSDGNEIGGIHTVLQQAPLGTYLGWNVTASGFMKGSSCSLAGSYVPFAETRKARESSHDSRLSLEERYHTHKGYVEKVRAAARELVGEHFLVQDDADRMVTEAEQSDVLR
jgi:hypothetical protein